MSQEYDENTPNGYIVRLYKREANISDITILNDSMFLTWMNFDCMDIVKVHRFQDYNNSVDLADVNDREIYTARQKFFIYNLNMDEKEISFCAKGEELLSTAETLKDFPLITLTMLNIQQNMDSSDSLSDGSQCRKELQVFLKETCLQHENVRGQLYGSLSTYDYVLVFRGNDYREIDDILSACRERMLSKDIVFNKMYTIAGIDYRYVNAWKVDGLKVSVRLSCKSDVTECSLLNNAMLGVALHKPEIYSILGQYDFDIIGTVKSAEKFVALFLNDGLLSGKWDNIHKTNTRFLHMRSIPASDVRQGISVSGPEKRKNKFKENVEMPKEFRDLYDKIEGLSPSLREALSRLILRTFQVIITTNHSKMSGNLKRKLHDFLDFIYCHQRDKENLAVEEDKIQDVYAGMISTFNLLLDNRISAGISDFETPQQVLRYSGSSMKVLIAYSSYVDRLLEILEHNKNNENRAHEEKDALKYIAFVTAEPVTRVSATVSLSYSRQYRFINISIPIDLLFEVDNVLAWITHEAGHFIRAGWNRRERNAAYKRSVGRGLAEKLMPYKSSAFETRFQEATHEMKPEYLMMEREQDGEEGKKFDDYRKKVKEFFQAAIVQYTQNYNREFRIPYDRARDLYDDLEEITSSLQRIYEEAIADMFMLQVLGIKELAEYLKIHEAYFHRIDIDVNNLPQETISRIIAVSIVIAGIAPDDYEGIKTYFSGACSMCSDDGILPILKGLRDYSNYYLLEPLVFFLISYVKSGLESLLEEEKIKVNWQKIKDSYTSVKRGRFEDYIQFVLQYNE